MHDDQKTSDYPLGYTPMTDDDLKKLNIIYPMARVTARKLERAVLARLPKPDAEPVAWAMPNSAITDSNRFMMVRLEVPTDDEYGGAFWIPLYAHPPQDTAEHVPASPEVEARVDAAVEAGRINDNRDADHIVDANKMVSDTAERNALVRRIDAWGWFDFVTDTERLFKDIRAYLVKGGAT